MNVDQLSKLVSQGESVTLEFKKSTATLQSAFETLCGFLNSEGGTVLIGVTDHQKIIGQQISDSTMLDIAHKVSQIEPATQPDISYVPLPNGLQVIVISVKSGKHTPYTFNGRSFQRIQSRTNPMTQHRYEQLMSENTRPDCSWEMQLNHSDTRELDQGEVKKTLSIAVHVNRLIPESLDEDMEETLTKLELMREGRLTNAAMVLFAKSTSPDFPQCLIKLARFRGVDKLGGFIDNQMVNGNVFQIMKSANEFIMKHLPVASFFDEKNFERIDKPLLPVLAIREALSNALCHRDYSAHNSSINLAIFDDRLEIWNNGLLVTPLTIDDLKKTHQSYPRNRRIAKVFYLRKYVETWGTGTTKMIAQCRKSNVPEPFFSEYSGGFSVTFKFSSPMGVPASSKDAATHEHQTRRNHILSILNEEPMSAGEIHNKLQSVTSLRSIKRDLSDLQKKGIVKQVGKGKNTLWTIDND